MAQLPVATSRARPRYLCSTPGAPPAARSPTASCTKPGTGRSSSSSGSTCRSSGSSGSPLRIRATKPRGTRSGNCAVALAETRAASPGSSSMRSSSAGSRTASRQARRQSAATAAGAAGCGAGGGAGIMSGSGSARRAVWAPHSKAWPPRAAAAKTQELRMASYGMNDVKKGMKIIVNGEPCVITDTEYVKPGKGQAVTRVQYRYIKSGRMQEITLKSTDSLAAADGIDTDMQCLYDDGGFWHCMQPDTFEQVQADKNGVGEAAKWLKGEEDCVVTLWNGTPISVTPPNFVELKVVQTDPGVRGDTS